MIVPIIGQLKADGKLGRNYCQLSKDSLLDQLDDKFDTLLAELATKFILTSKSCGEDHQQKELLPFSAVLG